MLLESNSDMTALGLHIEGTTLAPSQSRVQLLITNYMGFTLRLSFGEVVGHMEDVELVSNQVQLTSQPAAGLVTDIVRKISSEQIDRRKKQLLTMLAGDLKLPSEEKEFFCEFLAEDHAAFCLEEGEQGETSLVQLHTDTGNVPPCKQAPRRTPFVVRQEIEKQVERMKAAGVIQESSSQWASPVILVKKKDGTYRFCVDYRLLNEVTTKDTFPLPRIDDLLDQLGRCKYFSTLDLAAGYWQIQVDTTAFVTHRGLYEFNVMPFGLTNAPSVFQRLVQGLLIDLNSVEDPDFVSSYIDDILIFSRALTEHLAHL
jgi:hypothetical protein